MKSNKIASPYLRLLAFLIDVFISFIPVLIVVNLISLSIDIETLLNKIPLLGLFVFLPTLELFVKVSMISVLGGTFGKLLTGTAIVDDDGKYLSFWKAVWRNLVGYFVSGLALWTGFVWICIDKDRQGWHDMMADSYVVVKNKVMGFVGIIALGLLVSLAVLLINRTILNFKTNSNIYSDIYSEIQESMKPAPTLNPSLSK